MPRSGRSPLTKKMGLRDGGGIRPLAAAVVAVMVAAAASCPGGGAADADLLVPVARLGPYVAAVLAEVRSSDRRRRRTPADEAPALRPAGVPDLRDHPHDYKGAMVGKVEAEHEYPGTEGYRPADGYFSQSEPCERLMRMWTERCAFKEHKDSLYWKGADKLYPTAAPGGDKPLSTSNYIGNLMAQAAPLSQKYHAAGGAK